MELSSFETSAFNRRQTERYATADRTWIALARVNLPRLIAVVICACVAYVGSGMFSILNVGIVLTPDRLLVLITLFLILVTPFVKRQRKGGQTSVHPPMAPANAAPVSQPASIQPQEYSMPSATPMFSSERQAVSQYSHPVPSRYDQPATLGASTGSTRRGAYSLNSYSPAPFVDDIHSTAKHEYAETVPTWARGFEEKVLMPQIIIPFVKAMEESDMLLTLAFSQFGLKLATKIEPKSTKAAVDSTSSVVCLTDRFLPPLLAGYPEVVALWQRRQLLESLVTIPGYHQDNQFRDYIVSRIKLWAERGGVRFAYRPDNRPWSENHEGPTDSHILAHLVFSSFDAQMGISKGTYGASFRDKYVSETASVSSASRFGTGRMQDLEFNALFGGDNMKSSGGFHHNKIVWLEQVSGAGSVLHFNVGTNQKVFGIAPGAGNILEALCLFFHLLKKLSPNAGWIVFPHDLRMVLDSVLIDNTDRLADASLSGGLLSSSGLNPTAALPAIGGLF